MNLLKEIYDLSKQVLPRLPVELQPYLIAGQITNNGQPLVGAHVRLIESSLGNIPVTDINQGKVLEDQVQLGSTRVKDVVTLAQGRFIILTNHAVGFESKQLELALIPGQPVSFLRGVATVTFQNQDNWFHVIDADYRLQGDASNYSGGLKISSPTLKKVNFRAR